MNSMTGFGRTEGVVGSSHLTIELKSLNHRFLDIRFRMPSHFGQFEILVSDWLRTQFDRGSFELTVRQKLATQTGTVSATRFVVDELAAETLVKSAQSLQTKLKVDLTPSLSNLIQSEKVFIPIEETPEDRELWAGLKLLLERAALDLKKMRAVEGEKVKKILESGVSELKLFSSQIASLRLEQEKKFGEKLRSKVSQWNLSSEVDPSRLEIEVALLLERSDITEEIDRLKHHTVEFQEWLNATTPIGRKLDFLSQELQRETNTLGAKSNLLEITRLVVATKATIEKLREQVQNVE